MIQCFKSSVSTLYSFFLPVVFFIFCHHPSQLLRRQGFNPLLLTFRYQPVYQLAHFLCIVGTGSSKHRICTVCFPVLTLLNLRGWTDMEGFRLQRCLCCFCVPTCLPLISSRPWATGNARRSCRFAERFCSPSWQSNACHSRSEKSVCGLPYRLPSFSR